MNSLDTNYILRFLVKDVQSQFQKAFDLIANESVQKYIPAIVLAEVVYILEHHYQTPKTQVIQLLIELLSLDHIKCERFLISALEIYRDETMSFYDSLIIAESLEKKHQLKSFDEKLIMVYKERCRDES